MKLGERVSKVDGLIQPGKRSRIGGKVGRELGKNDMIAKDVAVGVEVSTSPLLPGL